MANLPTPPPVETAAEAASQVKPLEQPAGNSDLNILLQELNTPKQSFTPAPGDPSQTGPEPGPYFGAPGPEPEPVDPEQARRAGERAAKMADGILSFAAAMIAREKDSDLYSASDGDIKDLASAWADVATQYQFTVNPWVSVVFLTLTTYLPIYMKALDDRRYNKMRADIEGLQKQINDLNDIKNKAEAV